MTKSNLRSISNCYLQGRDIYAEIGVNTDLVLERLKTIPISINCWQGDDVAGFENSYYALTGGIAVTGNYPGRARNADELRMDLEKTLSLIPGKHRLNLHAIYAETDGEMVDRNELHSDHFRNWIDWAKQHVEGLDFNPTLFSHTNSEDGFTLSNSNSDIRKFWIEHCVACRKVGEMFGRELKTPCVTNIWIPDGYKDNPVDKYSPRQRLKESLDEILSVKVSPEYNLDAVESKLFGIGSESYVVGSHEFYLGYAVKNNLLICLDSGHFHPTEKISDKISAVLSFLPEILLHVSRPVRWDSDHVVLLDDELLAISKELVRNEFLTRTHIGLDFFDASINRVAAWVIGTRNMIKSLLIALLEPTEMLKKLELDRDFTSRLGILEDLKTLPFGAVWDYYCLVQDVPVGLNWLSEVGKYEKDVLSSRV